MTLPFLVLVLLVRLGAVVCFGAAFRRRGVPVALGRGLQRWQVVRGR